VSEDLLRRWRALAGDEAEALGLELLRAWTETNRRYHDRSHLLWLLEEADRRSALIEDPAFVGFAIWFHDAVYQPGRSDNEAQSAAWARTALAHDGARAEAVAQVIEMTKNHWQGDAAGDAALFLDMDIAILGAEPASYRAYAAGVRAEYAQFADAAYSAGRSAFLDGVLGRARIFRTGFYESALSSSARANMAWERELLRRGGTVHDDAR
jgi:predicted metal-dependent HD superfamily phosphohydrolase